MRQGSTRERRRLGSVTPDETGDGIAGAEPQKIGLAIGKGKALMRCLSWRMTALRTGAKYRLDVRRMSSLVLSHTCRRQAWECNNKMESR